MAPCGSAAEAPTIRSSKPSPLTSPAEATEKPLWSSAATPSSLKPLLPSRLDRSRFGGEARGLAEHHIARARIVAVRVGEGSADDQVGEAVAVDVARRGDRPAAAVARRHAAELEAVAAVEARQVEVRRKARGLAEHHIARARDCRADRRTARRRSGRRSRRR